MVSYLQSDKSNDGKSKIQEASRESGNGWKPFMRSVFENPSGAVMPKAKAVKRYRMPALKDRIYAIAAGGRRYGLLESEVKN